MGFDGVNPFVLSLINEKMDAENYPNKIPTGIREIKEKGADEENNSIEQKAKET